MFQKRGQFWETLIPWIIAIGIILLVLILYFALSGKLGNISSYIKDWFRFGR
jgi:hypothetical protein